jgi:hypothetical protein
MPKKITISLHRIVTQIDQATGKLTAAENKTPAMAERKRLAIKIKNLKKIKGLVIKNCPKNGLNIVVPV